MQMGLTNISVTNHHTEIHPHLTKPHVGQSHASPSKVLTLNAASTSDGGMLWGGRKNADGNYYTITFPDDFVGEVNSGEEVNGIPKDPFHRYRSSVSPYPIDIPQGLNVTIQIPPGMQLGANTHRVHVGSGVVAGGFGNYPHNSETHQGAVGVVPGVNLNSWGFMFDAASDPCILIDLYTHPGPWSEGSAKVTRGTIENLNITIENYGNTIGCGGIGGQGGSRKKTELRSGAGGGGGAGIHMNVAATFSDVNDYSALWSSKDEGGIGIGSASQRQVANSLVDSPPAGVGGRGGSYHPEITTRTGTTANGTQGDAKLGTPGIGGPGSADNDLNTGGDISPSRGSWGGSVVYIRCNGVENPGTGYAGDTYAGPFAEKLTGTLLNIINKSTGRMYGGGGGGGAGDSGRFAGDGGPLGANGAMAQKGGASLGGTYHHGGSAGAIIHWNTSTIVPANTIVNESSFDIKGRDVLVPGV